MSIHEPGGEPQDGLVANAMERLERALEGDGLILLGDGRAIAQYIVEQLVKMTHFCSKRGYCLNRVCALFCGPRGTGKTTVMKSLCEHVGSVFNKDRCVCGKVVGVFTTLVAGFRDDEGDSLHPSLGEHVWSRVFPSRSACPTSVTELM